MNKATASASDANVFAIERSTPALRILLSVAADREYGDRIRAALGQRPHLLVKLDLESDDTVGEFDIAFLTRDVTGRSTRDVILPSTQRFYRALSASLSLTWLHIHSSGADRVIYTNLAARGVEVTASAGANAEVVAQTALAGLLSLARLFPRFSVAQSAKQWAPLTQDQWPPDLRAQTATIVGWGAVGQRLATYLRVLGMRVLVARQQAAPAEGADKTVRYRELDQVLPETDWLALACPLSDQTRHLINGRAFELLPRTARLINVARGDVVRQVDLIAALRDGRLAGAHLDVFSPEPLDSESPLWGLPNVIVTPHAAGAAAGNAERVFEIFLAQLKQRYPPV